MDDIEKRIMLLETDRDCLMKFKQEMIDTFRTRDPAKQTYKFIGEVQTSMALNIKDHDELKEGMKRIEKKMDEFIGSCPTKADSWAESVLKIIGYIVITILVGAFMFLVIKENLIR